MKKRAIWFVLAIILVVLLIILGGIDWSGESENDTEKEDLFYLPDVKVLKIETGQIQYTNKEGNPDVVVYEWNFNENEKMTQKYSDFLTSTGFIIDKTKTSEEGILDENWKLEYRIIYTNMDMNRLIWVYVFEETDVLYVKIMRDGRNGQETWEYLLHPEDMDAWKSELENLLKRSHEYLEVID